MSHSPPPTLTRDELADITGYKRGSDQFKLLKSQGWSVTWSEPTHRAIVHRMWYEAHITGQHVPRKRSMGVGRKDGGWS